MKSIRNRFGAARLIIENQILHIPQAVNGTEVFVSNFGILLDAKAIKFNQDGIWLRAVEIGRDYILFSYGTEKKAESMRLGLPDLDMDECLRIAERFRYETGVIPVVRESSGGMSTVERIKCGVVNCYLLTGSAGSVLVDAGNPSDVSRIYSLVKDKNVRLILLTHGHPDHTGAASGLAGLLHVPIAMGREDAILLEAPDARKLQGHTFLGRILALASQQGLRKVADARFTPDLWLEDGQELSEYGVEAKIVSLPGHTQGSVGVLTASGDFIAGDALFNIFRPTAALLYEDREQMDKSVENIVQSGAKFLYPGHGKPFSITKFTR